MRKAPSQSTFTAIQSHSFETCTRQFHRCTSIRSRASNYGRQESRFLHSTRSVHSDSQTSRVLRRSDRYQYRCRKKAFLTRICFAKAPVEGRLYPSRSISSAAPATRQRPPSAPRPSRSSPDLRSPSPSPSVRLPPIRRPADGGNSDKDHGIVEGPRLRTEKELQELGKELEYIERCNAYNDRWNAELRNLEKLYKRRLIPIKSLRDELKSQLLLAISAGKAQYQIQLRNDQWNAYHEAYIEPLYTKLKSISAVTDSVGTGIRKIENDRLLEQQEYNERLSKYRADLVERAHACSDVHQAMKNRDGPHYHFLQVVNSACKSGANIQSCIIKNHDLWRDQNLGNEARKAFRDIVELAKHFDGRSAIGEIQWLAHTYRKHERVSAMVEIFPELAGILAWSMMSSKEVANVLDAAHDTLSAAQRLLRMSTKIGHINGLVDALKTNTLSIHTASYSFFNNGLTLCNPYLSSPFGAIWFWQMAPIERYQLLQAPFKDTLQSVADALTSIRQQNKDRRDEGFMVRSIEKLSKGISTLSVHNREFYGASNEFLAWSMARFLDENCVRQQRGQGPIESKFLDLKLSPLHAPTDLPNIVTMNLETNPTTNDGLLHLRSLLGDGSLYPQKSSIPIFYIDQYKHAMDELDEIVAESVIATDCIYMKNPEHENTPLSHLILTNGKKVVILDIQQLAGDPYEPFVSKLRKLYETSNIVKVGWRMDWQRESLKCYSVYAKSCVNIPTIDKEFESFIQESQSAWSRHSSLQASSTTRRRISPMEQDFQQAARPLIALQTFLTNFGDEQRRLLPTATYLHIQDAQLSMKSMIHEGRELGPYRYGLASQNRLAVLKKFALLMAGAKIRQIRAENARWNSKILRKPKLEQALVRFLASYHLKTKYGESLATISNIFTTKLPAKQILEIAQDFKMRLNDEDRKELEDATRREPRDYRSEKPQPVPQKELPNVSQKELQDDTEKIFLVRTWTQSP